MYSINVLTNFRGNFHNIYSVLTVPSRAFIHKRIYLVLPANKTVWLFGNASNFQIYEKYLNSRSDLFVCLQLRTKGVKAQRRMIYILHCMKIVNNLADNTRYRRTTAQLVNVW